MTTSAASSHAAGVGTEGGLVQLLRDHPRLLDVAVAGVALIASFSSVFYVAELTDWPIAAALSLPPVVSILWRRQAPVTVLGITLALGLLQWALAVPFGGAQLPALIALYTVARLSSRRDSRYALAGALLLVLISPLRQPYSDSISTLFMVLLVMVIYVLGT